MQEVSVQADEIVAVEFLVDERVGLLVEIHSGEDLRIVDERATEYLIQCADQRRVKLDLRNATLAGLDDEVADVDGQTAEEVMRDRILRLAQLRRECWGVLETADPRGWRAEKAVLVEFRKVVCVGKAIVAALTRPVDQSDRAAAPGHERHSETR